MTTRRRVVLAGIGVVALAAFAGLAVAVTGGWAPLVRLDASWHEGLRQFGLARPGWLSTMEVVTHFGDTVTIFAIDVALFIVCLARRWSGRAVLVVIVGLGGWALRLALSDLIDRPRPDDSFWPADGASFPSGHTTNSTLMVVLVSIVCWPLVGQAARYLLVAGAVIYALAVGFSRMAGAVHWPTDVAGGLLFAVGFGCVVAAALPWARGTDKATAEEPIGNR